MAMNLSNRPSESEELPYDEFPDSELNAYGDDLCGSCHGMGSIVDDDGEDSPCPVCDGKGYIDSE
jgi:rubrerythrin